MTATVPSAEHAAYVDEVIESASVLESLDEAAPAEAWASGAVAEWLGIGGVALGDAVAGRSSPAEAAIRWIE
ncbi:MAG: hypothetical protein HKO87_04415, partial [Acidimicrobiia bacterium]|nr:hypothetical protein [Acidimicrobiia bacterium]